MTRKASAQSNRYAAALVVFSGRTDLPALRILKPGFRHCFAVVQCDGDWLLVEPLAHRLEVSVLPDVPKSI